MAYVYIQDTEPSISLSDHLAGYTEMPVVKAGE